MGLSSKDRAFNTKKVSYLDFKQLEMDRVLTALFARLAHNGFPSRLKRRFELSVEAFVDEFLEHPEWFTGFAQHREIAIPPRHTTHEGRWYGGRPSVSTAVMRANRLRAPPCRAEARAKPCAVPGPRG